MEHPSEHDCKLRFAYYLHKLGNALDAMMQLSSEHGWDDTNWILATYKRWQFDPIVEAEVSRLNSIVKTKEQHLNFLWETMEEAKRAGDYKAFASLAKVFSDTAGFIKKVNDGAKNEGTEDTFDDATVPPLEPIEGATTSGKVENGELQSEVS